MLLRENRTRGRGRAVVCTSAVAAAVLLAAGLRATAAAPGPDAPAGDKEGPGQVRRRVLASVVGIRAKLRVPRIKFTGRRKVVAELTPSEGTGSGVVVHPSGVILTCAHLVGEGGKVRVFLADDHEVQGTVIVNDRTSDLALVKVEAGPLPALDLEAAPRLWRGQAVFLASRPGGASVRFTEGSLVAPGCYHVGHSQLEFFRRFTSEIEPGDSGGVLVDEEGRLIGIISVGLPDGMVGYAIAREFALVALARLRLGPPVVWPWIGLAVETPAGGPDAAGVMIWTVAAGSPAAAAGLRAGDRIVSVDGRPVEHFTVAMLHIVSRPIGSRFELEIARPGTDARLELRVLSSMRPLEPVLDPLDVFERHTGIRLEVSQPSPTRAGGLRVVAAPTGPEGTTRRYTIGSRLLAVVPGFGLVRALEEGRTDQDLRIETVRDLGEALRASVVGDRVAAALVWETAGARSTMFISGEARRYPIL